MRRRRSSELGLAARDRIPSGMYLRELIRRCPGRGTKDEGMLYASAALTQAYIDEASGHPARARERYRAAMDQ